jgi:hypothetical protein
VPPAATRPSASRPASSCQRVGAPLRDPVRAVALPEPAAASMAPMPTSRNALGALDLPGMTEPQSAGTYGIEIERDATVVALPGCIACRVSIGRTPPRGGETTVSQTPSNGCVGVPNP